LQNSASLRPMPLGSQFFQDLRQCAGHLDRQLNQLSGSSLASANFISSGLRGLVVSRPKQLGQSQPWSHARAGIQRIA
jgi:hypothetical protein